MRACLRAGLLRGLWVIATIVLCHAAAAAPYAAMVTDARTGEVLHARSADERLHPASLTKMMTLYVVFEAIGAGEVGLDDEIRISTHAASEPPSKLGLSAGSTIRLRYLIRAAAVKSANDAATALGEAVAGSEEAFAARMNRTAAAMGMTRTTFRNAHGLTQSGHLSTARDMTVLGRHLFYDYPEYYNLFSRAQTDAGLQTVANTNRRFLRDYAGADGIKTGYTHAAGFNLVASAERDGVRIIATVFGGRSTATRNARVAELLDMGFDRAPARVAAHPPSPPDYDAVPLPVQVSGAITQSPRPPMRPGAVVPPGHEVGPALVVALADEVATEVATRRVGNPSLVPLATPEVTLPEEVATAAAAALSASPPPSVRPMPPAGETAEAVAEAAEAAVLEVVLRPSADAPRAWGIAVGRHDSRYLAERTLLRTALVDADALDGAQRRVVRRTTGFEAGFVGLTREDADRACRRIRARGGECETVGGGEAPRR